MPKLPYTATTMSMSVI